MRASHVFSDDLKEEMSKAATENTSFKGCNVGAAAPKTNSIIQTRILGRSWDDTSWAELWGAGDTTQANTYFQAMRRCAFKSTTATISHAQKKKESKSPSRVERD